MITSDPVKVAPVSVAARPAATAGRSARRAESEPYAPTRKRAGSSPADRSFRAAPGGTGLVDERALDRPAPGAVGPQERPIDVEQNELHAENIIDQWLDEVAGCPVS